MTSYPGCGGAVCHKSTAHWRIQDLRGGGGGGGGGGEGKAQVGVFPISINLLKAQYS